MGLPPVMHLRLLSIELKDYKVIERGLQILGQLRLPRKEMKKEGNSARSTVSKAFETHEQRFERLKCNKSGSAASRAVETLDQRVERIEGNRHGSATSKSVESPEQRLERLQC